MTGDFRRLWMLTPCSWTEEKVNDRRVSPCACNVNWNVDCSTAITFPPPPPPPDECFASGLDLLWCFFFIFCSSFFLFLMACLACPFGMVTIIVGWLLLVRPRCVLVSSSRNEGGKVFLNGFENPAIVYANRMSTTWNL